ncbi:hypothetical protein [Actinomadura sp. 9N215]|uniref:hypothetical protein n=1 Tax=Actinomadura sp. 9N215 TaxID=3375150 RepID=UPI0037AEA060
MQGKHGKNRFPLGPRTTGALFGLAFFGVVASTAHASVLSDGTDPGDKVAAVEVLPQKQKSDRTSPGGSGKESDDEKSDQKSREKSGEKSGEKSEASNERSNGTSGKVERSEVIARARTWNPGTDDRVRYSQLRSHNGYRADCSGFVAMTLGLPKPGPNTVGLTSSRYTERIKMSELKKGDLVMDAEGTNTTRHVVIFEKWANSDRTSYWAYEQRGRYGTDHRTRDYGLDSGSEYKAYRPTKL